MLKILMTRLRRSEAMRRFVRPLVICLISLYYRGLEGIIAGRQKTKRILLFSAWAPLAEAYRRLNGRTARLPIIGPIISIPVILSGNRSASKAADARRAFEAAAGEGRLGVGTTATGDQIVMLVISDLRIDPRVEREARALAQAGWQVSVLYPDIFSPAGTPTHLDWGANITFERLPLSYAEYTSIHPGLYGTDYLKAALRYRPFAFHAHDLSTALIGITAAEVTGAHAVCDFHEWFSENVEWDPFAERYIPIKPASRAIWRATESEVLSKASSVITVCESIAHDLEQELGDGRKRIHVIRNIPDTTTETTVPYHSVRQQFRLSSEQFVILWQGGTGPTRLIEPIIESLQYVANAVFIIRGPSLDLFGDGYRQVARDAGVENRLILAPPVPSRDVVAAARGADVGIWTLPDLCRNFRYALPNKIFEYLAASLPVLVANYPEAKRLVVDNGVGLAFDPVDARSIAAVIMSLKTDPQLRRAMENRIPALLRDLDASREWQKLADLYANLKGARGWPTNVPLQGR